MRITADTNILVRLIVRDDPIQAQRALDLLESAETVVVSLPCLCELAWVLHRTYGFPRDRIATVVGALVERANVAAEVQPVAMGLDMLQAGGDFADGVIAAAGAAQGGDVFVSFDRKAVKLLSVIGVHARDARDFA